MPILRLFNEELMNCMLYELEQLFNASTNTSLKDHKLLMPNGFLMNETTNKLLREELKYYDITELGNNHLSSVPRSAKPMPQENL